MHLLLAPSPATGIHTATTAATVEKKMKTTNTEIPGAA